MSTLELSLGMMNYTDHYPVMYREALDFLDVKNKKLIVDCTVGVGSHALKFLQVMRDDAMLIGIDRDGDSLKICADRLGDFRNRVILVNDNFANLEGILKGLDISGVDVFFFDLGISSYQICTPERGFSFLRDGPLDMRMDREAFLSAYDLINNLSERELVNIFRKFGEERYAARIARSIIETRRMQAIATTAQLAEIVLRAVPFKTRKYKIHPATRVFQALRIVVNRELESISKGINTAVRFLNPGGRIGVISFHSLEDRIVKHTMKDFSTQGVLKIITKKPLLPSDIEREENTRSRSAKLRIAEKCPVS
jgi:16S rRNA (cytosine1402-N4)-methyltransferase